MVDKDREEQFLKQVENAAKKGASKGVRNNSFISLVITILLIYDIKVDNDNKIISLYIPYPIQEAININENDIQFGDVEKVY